MPQPWLAPIRDRRSNPAVRCILTAGPTGEPLDQVRRLTNHSTGSLGTGLANHLVSLGHEVLLLRGELCTAPPPIAAVEVIPFSSVADLSRKLLAQATVDPVRIFHAAAVSDFTFGPIFFQNADGELDERDINQCLSGLNIGT